MIITKQPTRAFTVSSVVSRRTRGGNGASALQAVRSFLLKVGPWQGPILANQQNHCYRKDVTGGSWSYQCTPVLRLVTRVSTDRGAGVLVVAKSFEVAIVTMVAKSSHPCR